MPKKPKVNKLARMSDEERARYLQHRADIEEEARRRKRELVARFIKNKLDKEEAYSRMNTAKLNQGWRYILRKIKCKQMTLEITSAMTNFNFIVERKDRLIKTLLKAIEDSDDQHRRAFQSHTETLSYFLTIGSQRLDKLQAAYEHQKDVLLDNWDKEEMTTSDNEEKAEFKLKLIVFIQDRKFKNHVKAKETERATLKNDARLEHEEEMVSLCRPKQLLIEKYWSQLREVYNSYMEKHNPIMGLYNSLREKDDFYQRDIARNEKMIQQATDLVIQLQKEWVTTTTTSASKLQRMTAHKEDLAKRYWQMKRDVKADGSKMSRKMETMVNASLDAVKCLEDLKEKLEKIQQLADICSKYENEDDVRSMRNMDNNGILNDFDNLDKAMIDECKEYRKMDKFMLKMNRVQVQVMCLKTEKAKLARENVQIKQYIKRYLTDMALKGGKDRPFSVKIPSSEQKIDGKLLNRPVTCIEGALSNAVVHEKRMKVQERRKKELEIKAFPRIQCWT